MKNNTIISILYVIVSQICAFALSAFITLFLPKILSVEGYSYWQLFTFYTIYVGVLHFGIADGLYLRLGGKHYEDLNYSIIKSQIACMVLAQIVVGGVIFGGISIGDIDKSRRWILENIVIFAIMENIAILIGFVLQAVNKINQYAKAVMINKICTLVLFGFLVIKGVNSFKPFVVCYLLSQLVAVMYYSVVAKEIFFARVKINKYVLNEMKANILCGLNLTISTVSGNLIIGITRKIIDWKWGIVVFGKLSLAFSLVCFFQQLLGQGGAVFFPVLRRNDEEVGISFSKMCNFLNAFLLFVFVAYVPFACFIKAWLPEYGDSVQYLTMLLPICIFDGKFSVLCSTYLKVLRKEKKLMITNCISMVVCFSFCILFTICNMSIFTVIIVPIFVIFLRSLFLEIYIRKLLNIKLSQKQFAIIIVVLLMWMVILFVENSIMTVLLCCVVYAFYLYINKTNLVQYFRFIDRNTVKGRK